MMTRVTWLLPVKDGMPYLPETLASIEAQTFHDWEVLAWDNGSTDGTVEELQRWIPSRLPGRVVTDRPMSLAASLAEMTRQAGTEFCARIDADDVNLPERLERQVAFLTAHPEVAAAGSWTTRLDERGIDHGLFHAPPAGHAEIVRFLLRTNALAHPTVLFRRAAVLEAGNYADVPQAEDYELWLRMAAQGQRLANIDVPLVQYRFHDKSATQIQATQNILAGAMDDHLYQHAPELYGVTETELKPLRAGRHPASAKLLRRIARHLHQSHQGADTEEGLRLALLRDWRASVSPRDLSSRFAVTVAEGGRRALPREVGRIGWAAAKKVLRPLVGAKGRAAYRDYRDARWKRRQAAMERRAEAEWQARLLQWIGERKQQGAMVHPSLQIIGEHTHLECLSIGRDCAFERDVTIWISPDAGAEPTLEVQGPSFIGRNTYLGLYQPIRIGAWSMIGAYCYLVSGNHSYQRRDIPIAQQGYSGARIVIEEDVWLGTHVVVLPGVTIGRGAIVAAGSIVNKDIPPYEIWGGMPAKFLKTRPG